MSIISEALKKAQEQSGQLKKEAVAPDTSIKKNKQPAKPKGNRLINLLLFGLALTIPALIMVDLKTGSVKDAPPKSVVIKTSPTASVEEEKVEAKAEAVETHPYISSADSVDQSYTLSGIVFGNGNPYAVINGMILEKGDWMGEAQVTSIEKNKVTLSTKGKKVTLILK